jgi:hypothetical protein
MLYFEADCKVMIFGIFGQETNDWMGLFPHSGGVDQLLETYRDFYSTGQCLRGQFWNAVAAFKRALTERLEPSGVIVYRGKVVH